nr:MAG TPA: hypothetical protein [Bacteriophage sp.]
MVLNLIFLPLQVIVHADYFLPYFLILIKFYICNNN